MIAQVAASRSLLRDYVGLTKPRIISLLLVTALGGMFVAAQGAPDPTLVALVLIGGSLAAGGANALNHSLESDIDSSMRRTQGRPVASGRVTAFQAMAFGVGFNLVAFTMLATWVNPLTAVITLSGTLFYVFVYTMGLKRSTPQNIVIGGAAGSVPPMAGWAAVTGEVNVAAIYMFAIIFLWTPPHFWALALLIKDDYKRAGIPMLPVVTGVEQTKRSIMLYALLLVAVTLLFATDPAVGWIYLLAAAMLGAAFVYYSYNLLRRPEILGARGLYLYSILYLAVLFFAMMVDSII